MENPKPDSNIPLQDEDLDKVAGGASVPIETVQTNVTTNGGGGLLSGGQLSTLVQGTLNAVNQQKRGA
jgi:hypothetical protein